METLAVFIPKVNFFRSPGKCLSKANIKNNLRVEIARLNRVRKMKRQEHTYLIQNVILARSFVSFIERQALDRIEHHVRGKGK